LQSQTPEIENGGKKCGRGEMSISKKARFFDGLEAGKPASRRMPARKKKWKNGRARRAVREVAGER